MTEAREGHSGSPERPATAADDQQSSGTETLFDADPVRSEQVLRDLRRKLVRFLSHDCRDPEEAAQEVLSRGLRRLRAGVDIMQNGPHAFFFGIAKNVIRENRKPHAHREQQLEPQEWEMKGSAVSEVARLEARIELGQYLECLSADEARLLVRWCRGDKEALMRERGVSAGNLRVMVFRIRERLRERRDAGSGRRRG